MANDTPWYPPIVAVVPRAVFARYEGRPWNDVKAAADVGTDSLSLRSGKDTAAKDTALLRPASVHERSLHGLSLLYSRGW